MNIATEVGTAKAEIIKVADELKAVIIRANSAALVILPIVAKGLAAAAAVLSLACPQASGAAAVLATATEAVDYADNAIVTADGIVMHPNMANAIGAQVAGPASNEQKTAFAVDRVKKLHPEMKPELADNAAHIAVQAAVAQLHHVDIAQKSSPAAAA